MCAEGRRGERGAAALEFAAVVPVLLLLVFGIIDIARYAFTLISLREAASVAVRAAAMGERAEAVEALARRSAPFLGSGLVIICTGCGMTDPNRVMTYSITARFTFQPVAPLLPAFDTAITERTEVRS